MDKLTEIEQSVLGDILYEEYKKQLSKIDGKPEIIESIVTKYWQNNHAMFRTGLMMEECKDLLRDEQTDFSPEEQ